MSQPTELLLADVVNLGDLVGTLRESLRCELKTKLATIAAASGVELEQRIADLARNAAQAISGMPVAIPDEYTRK